MTVEDRIRAAIAYARTEIEEALTCTPQHSVYPPSYGRARACALTKLDEARMWALEAAA